MCASIRAVSRSTELLGRPGCRWASAGLLALGLAAGSAVAQELTPRFYAPAPTDKADVQSSSRLGVTLTLPLGRRSALNVAWATGFTTRIGADFDTIAVGLQTVWFGKP
jgi:hypothetical protein